MESPSVHTAASEGYARQAGTYARGRPDYPPFLEQWLRDALRQKSVGVIEHDEAKGVTKYAKPAGVIASLIPTTNPELTPPVTGIYAISARMR